MNENPSDGSARREFVYERVMNAPRELVFKAYTEVEHLSKWWGPKDMPITVFGFDLRPGGAFFYGMAVPGGFAYGKLVYQEISVPERLSFITSFTDADGNPIRHPMAANWPLEVLSTQTFIAEDDKTRIVARAYPVNASPEEIAMFESASDGMTQGNDGMYENFAAYLETLKQV